MADDGIIHEWFVFKCEPIKCDNMNSGHRLNSIDPHLIGGPIRSNMPMTHFDDDIRPSNYQFKVFIFGFNSFLCLK